MVIFTPLEKPRGSTTKVMKKNQKKDQAAARRTKAASRVSSTLDSQRSAARKLNNEIVAVAGKTVTFRKKAPKTPKGVVKRVASILHPDSDLARWAEILSKPFLVEGIFCPVSYNPAPSFIQSTARTTSTDLNITVAGNTTTQIIVFPGHYMAAGENIGGSGAEMDAVSYHSLDCVQGGAVRYVIGPMTKTDPTGTRTACIGARNAGVGLGLQVNDVSSGTPLAWDVSLPYTSVTASGAGDGHHSRWQLVAMGFEVIQTTPEMTRGGNVVTVQPNNFYVPAASESQATLEKFPTFREWGPDGCRISWIPRAQDMAFWHATGATLGTSSSSAGAAIMCFLNNSTGSALSFSYRIVCHWQLAGSYLNTVGRPAAHSPELKSPIEKITSVLQNGHADASMARLLAEKAAGHDGSKSPGTWFETAEKIYNSGKKAVALGSRVAAGFA
jgi:hypothetical protein